MSTLTASDANRRTAADHARRAAVSGIAFAALLTAGLVLVDRIPRLDSPDSTYTTFYTTGANTSLVTVGLYLVPFAGIAFLWYMTMVRALLRAMPSRPSEIQEGLQLAAGVTFIALLFAGTAAAGAVGLLLHLTNVPLPSIDVARVLSSVGYGMVFVYAVRVAAMFTIVTTTMVRSAGLLPRWLALVSYLMAAFLLVNTTNHPATLLVYPAWVLLISGSLLVVARKAGAPTAPTAGPTSSPEHLP